MATIRLVGYLKKIAGFHEKQFDLNKSTKISELVSFGDLGNDRIVVLINEEGASMDSEIQNQDKVKILPVIGGG